MINNDVKISYTICFSGADHKKLYKIGFSDNIIQSRASQSLKLAVEVSTIRRR